MDIEKLKNDLIRDEGQFNPLGFDHLGYVTFGIGHNMEANPFSVKQRNRGKLMGFNSQAFIDSIFEDDVELVIAKVSIQIKWIHKMPEPVQRAICNMCFQMGVKGTHEFMDDMGINDVYDDLIAGHYKLAAEKMGKSKWAHQTPKRAIRVLNLIASAEKGE